MKISLTLVTLVITLLAVLPFFWFMFIGKTAMSKNKKIITDLIKEENLIFNLKEQWNNKFIGIDETNRMLLFIKLDATDRQITKIDLNDVKSCHLERIARDYKKEKKVESELQTLHLNLTFASRKPDTTLEFYDIKENFFEEFEMSRAETWETAIKKHINKPSLNISAA